MPVDVRVRVDLQEVFRGLEGIAAFGKNPAAAYRELKKPLRADQRDHGKQAEGSDGKWPPRKSRGRRRLLGKLTTAIKVESNRASVSAEGRAKWSGAHQDGARVGRRRLVDLPKREHIYASDAMMELAERTFEEHLLGSFVEAV